MTTTVYLVVTDVVDLPPVFKIYDNEDAARADASKYPSTSVVEWRMHSHYPELVTPSADPLHIVPNPEHGPQLWYTDGHFAQRLDHDDIDNLPELTRRDLKLIRGTVELGLTRCAELERDWQAREYPTNVPRAMPPVPIYPQPF